MPVEATETEETAPVATAVESAEAETAAASADEDVVDGGGASDGGMAVEEAAPAEEEKPAPSKDVVKDAEEAPSAAAAPASPPKAKENGSDESKPVEADASNGTAAITAVGDQGSGGAVEKEGGENGEITLDEKDGKSKDVAGDGEEKAKTEEPAAKKADMEVEPPPKEDVVVDYTDEFGRVRQMLQR